MRTDDSRTEATRLTARVLGRLAEGLPRYRLVVLGEVVAVLDDLADNPMFAEELAGIELCRSAVRRMVDSGVVPGTLAGDEIRCRYCGEDYRQDRYGRVCVHLPDCTGGGYTA